MGVTDTFNVQLEQSGVLAVCVFVGDSELSGAAVPSLPPRQGHDVCC